MSSNSTEAFNQRQPAPHAPSCAPSRAPPPLLEGVRAVGQARGDPQAVGGCQRAQAGCGGLGIDTPGYHFQWNKGATVRYICYAAVHLLRSGTSGPASSDAAVPRRAAAQFGAAHVVGVPGWMAWMRGGGEQGLGGWLG